jgi:hypothetical protein
MHRNEPFPDKNTKTPIYIRNIYWQKAQPRQTANKIKQAQWLLFYLTISLFA